jgi:uncharacterized protein with WD repeat
MTNEDIRTIAGTAYDGSKGATDPPYIELDAQAQSMLFDSASAIINYGGPTTTYEVAVAEAAAVFVPLGAPPPGGDALSVAAAKLHKEREEEKARIAAWKGDVTEEERKAREKEQDRLQKEEERIMKERAKAPKDAPKGGPTQLPADEARLKQERDAEKARIAAWKGAVTKEEKDRREDEEERLDKEEDRIKKAKLVKNGPDKK